MELHRANLGDVCESDRQLTSLSVCQIHKHHLNLLYVQSNTDNTNLWGPKKKFVLTDFRVMNYENLDEKVSSNSVNSYTLTW